MVEILIPWRTEWKIFYVLSLVQAKICASEYSWMVFDGSWAKNSVYNHHIFFGDMLLSDKGYFKLFQAIYKGFILTDFYLL